MNTIITTTEIMMESSPKRTKNAKPVYCIHTGKIYASVTDAAIAEGVHLSTISLACNRGCKANGKYWCFVEDMPRYAWRIAQITKELYKDAPRVARRRKLYLLGSSCNTFARS